MAIALRIMIPAGFMPGAASLTGLPFALVLCTADGAKVVNAADLPGQDQKAPAEKLMSHAPCPFAGLGEPVVASNFASVSAVEFAAYVHPARNPAVAPAPGRGLAAPPLPARGPPLLLI